MELKNYRLYVFSNSVIRNGLRLSMPTALPPFQLIGGFVRVRRKRATRVCKVIGGDTECPPAGLPIEQVHGDFFSLFFILRRMGKNKDLAHHTSTYFHTRRVSI